MRLTTIVLSPLLFSAALGALSTTLITGEEIPTVVGWPFDAIEAAKRQEAAAQMLGAPVVLKSALPGGQIITWRLIPAGRFIMGSPTNEDWHEGDERLHPENIAKSFYMMETQLTTGQYQALLQRVPSAGGESQLPAGLPYRDAVDVVLPALRALTDLPQGWTVVLPDRVRLEYASRAGVATMNNGGNKESDLDAYGWYAGNSGGKVHPVALKKPNAWGIYDMLGNRWHWIWYAPGGYGDKSTKDHLVYGGDKSSPGKSNGARLANLMISEKVEGARYLLLPPGDALPPGHP
jgi:formylglycine-generating enzyme required for sulfatase activity